MSDRVSLSLPRCMKLLDCRNENRVVAVTIIRFNNYYTLFDKV